MVCNPVAGGLALGLLIVITSFDKDCACLTSAYTYGWWIDQVTGFRPPCCYITEAYITYILECPYLSRSQVQSRNTSILQK